MDSWERANRVEEFRYAEVDEIKELDFSQPETKAIVLKKVKALCEENRQQDKTIDELYMKLESQHVEIETLEKVIIRQARKIEYLSSTLEENNICY